MKDILAAIGAWRLCNMMLDENARLPASANFRTDDRTHAQTPA